MIEQSTLTDVAPEVPCPACRKKNVWSIANPHRPFCSERCKTTDFIAWASEEQVIPGQSPFTESLQH